MPKNIPRNIPDPATQRVLDNITTELFAGMVLCPATPEDLAWNRAHQRAANIIALYRMGEGLFQMAPRKNTGQDSKR